MDDILFESNTSKPEEFNFNGEIIENFGDVKIVSGDFLNRILNEANPL